VGAQLTIFHKNAIQVCFHRKQLKGISPLYWNISCNTYTSYAAKANPENTADTIFLRDIIYYVGIAFVDPNSGPDEIIFSLGRPEDDCPFGTAFNELSACVSPTNITSNETVTIPFLKSQDALYFAFEVPENVGSVMVYSPNARNSFIMLIRLQGTPTNTHKDGESGSSAFLMFPRPGHYLLRVRATQNVTDGQIAIRFERCFSTNMTGPGCGYFYNQSNYDSAVVTKRGVYKYWIMTVPAGTVASVSIAPDEGDLWNYQLFASYGQLPQKNNAEISNCYGSGCQGARNINITAGLTDEVWYVSVLPENNNHTYAIWFRSVCAPDCPNHGLCTMSGEFIGKCACSAEYSGAACQISNKLSAQYIVLIIIACLLFSSAILGFMAQAYLKRKGYQNI